MKCVHCKKIINKKIESWDYWVWKDMKAIETFHIECENDFIRRNLK